MLNLVCSLFVSHKLFILRLFVNEIIGKLKFSVVNRTAETSGLQFNVVFAVFYASAMQNTVVKHAVFNIKIALTTVFAPTVNLK